MSTSPDRPPEWSRGPVSSLFDKLSRSLRDQIDRAIIQRDPPRLIDVYNSYQLGISGIGQAAFYRYAARLRAAATLDHFAHLARADGRDPIETMSTVLDAEFIRLSTADGSLADEARTDADPYAIDESALKRLHRIIIMRQRLASTRLSAERAATHREDAELRRNNKQTRDLAAALRAYASARLSRAARDGDPLPPDDDNAPEPPAPDRPPPP